MKNESKSWWHVFLSWQIMALCMFFSNIPVSYAQSPDKITVAGCVKDAAGDFLIGATVQVKGISGGTITDIDGNYILKDVPRTATLVFSYVGMQNKEHHLPVIVPDDQMRSFILVAGTYEESVIYVEPAELQLVRGQKVRVMGGVFEGAVGEFVRIRRDRRVVVNIEGVMAVATTFIHSSLVEPITD